MKDIVDIRESIYNHFQNSAKCQKYFNDPANKEQYVAYYNSMYLLQDTIEGLHNHRQKGFSDNPLDAYIEFWGVMQALIIQQDAIMELIKIMADKRLDPRKIKTWADIRYLRNVCAGHPARKDQSKTGPLTRTFMRRGFGDYNEIVYEKWEQGISVTHPRIKLGEMIDKYTIDAKVQLESVLCIMKRQWP